MGIPVLILGESGSGKTSSLRNFGTSEVGIINVARKPLPFRKRLPSINIPRDTKDAYTFVKNVLLKANAKSLVIDDSQYLMVFDSFRRAKEKSFDKFTEMCLNFYSLIDFIINDLPEEKIVYLLHHVEKDDTGRIKAKTIGKMLDNQLVLEGLFSIVLLCKTENKKYFFETQTDGFTTVKSPMDMLPRTMDNDLKIVDQKIREYWFAPEQAVTTTMPTNSEMQEAS